MSEVRGGAPVSFSLDGDVLTVRDEAGGGEIAMEVDAGASTTPATDAWFDVPVDDAVSIETTAIEVKQGTSAQIRSDEGEHYGSITDEEFTVGGGTYVDVDAVLKLFIYVEEGQVEGGLVGDDSNPESLRLTFETPTRVVVGARSYHEQPVATMTVPDDPEDLMTAASYLGSSIKEWSAERSWPTLRGHPPAIEHGDELHVPDRLSKPDTEVTVAVPRDIAAVLRVMPLAHYFGADVVPGEQAELRLGSQHVEPLGSGAELEQSVDDLLGHALVLDSLVRIGGYYSMPRYEYEELAAELPFYPPELYDLPIHRQLLEYLEVSYDTVAPYVPGWHAVGTLRPTVDDAETVPYLLNTLSRIHVTENGLPRQPVKPENPVDLSTSQAVRRNVANLSPAARARAADHEVRPADDSSILFVGWERPEHDSFAETDWARFQIDVAPTTSYRPSVTREELKSLLREPFAYVHYAGGVSEEGFVCSDGVLRFEDLPDGSVGAISFVWDRPTTPVLESIHQAASVACLLDETITPDTAQELAVYLALGRSPAASCRLTGVDAVRFYGDATLPVTRRPTGHPPFVVYVRQVGDDEFRVIYQLNSDDHDLIGRIAGLRSELSPDYCQLAGTEMEVPGVLSGAELTELLTHDNIYRFEWCLDTERSPSQPNIDDLRST
jgi:hypothetical protein